MIDTAYWFKAVVNRPSGRPGEVMLLRPGLPVYREIAEAHGYRAFQIKEQWRDKYPKSLSLDRTDIEEDVAWLKHRVISQVPNYFKWVSTAELMPVTLKGY